jgi:hypothetical protein
LAEHAELKDTPNRIAIIGKALGEMWRNLPAAERAPYEEMGKKSNAEYHQARFSDLLKMFLLFRSSKNTEKRKPWKQIRRAIPKSQRLR